MAQVLFLGQWHHSSSKFQEICVDTSNVTKHQKLYIKNACIHLVADATFQRLLDSYHSCKSKVSVGHSMFDAEASATKFHTFCASKWKYMAIFLGPSSASPITFPFLLLCPRKWGKSN